MPRKDYEYLAKCLAASVTAHFMGNTIEHEMRVFKGRAPGDLYYALASLLVQALVAKRPAGIDQLNRALEDQPK